MATPETASFAVSLKDETSGPADDAAQALQKLRDSIDGDLKSVRAMEAAMKRLKSATTPNVEVMEQLTSKIMASKKRIAENETAYVGLGGTFDKVKAKRPAMLFKEIGDAAGKVPGPLGGLVAKLGSLRAMVAGGVLIAGVVALAAGIVAVGAATVAVIAKLAAYGVAQANAARSELLRLEALTKLRHLYSATAGNANEMQAAMDRVADSTGAGRDKLEQYTAQLHRMGLRGSNLDAALEGMAIRGEVLGDRYAMAFAGMAVGAARAGRDVRQLTENVRGRLGGLLDRKMNDWDAQMTRLRRNVSGLFRGLQIEGFLRAVRTLTDLFSQTTASGRALKTIVETLFQPLINATEGAAPIVKRFFQGMILMSQKLVIAILGVRLWFKRTFGDRDILGGIDATAAALAAGEVAIAGLVGAAVAAVAVFGALAAAIAAPFVTVAGLIAGAKALHEQLVGWLESRLDAFRNIGSRIVDGLIQGIRGGFGNLGATLRNLGGVAADALRTYLDIHSPSRVFAGLGKQIPAGLAMGVEAGSARAEDAVGEMVGVPTGVSARGARGTTSVSFGDIYVNAQTDDPKGLARAFTAELAKALEGVAVIMGAPA